MLARAGVSDIITWSLILMAGLIVGLIVTVQLKRRLTGPQEPAPGGGFTLSDLRKLYKDGQMSTEEFEKAKTRIIGVARSKPMPEPPDEPPSEKNDLAGPPRTT